MTARSTPASSIIEIARSMVNGIGSCGCAPGTHFQSSDSAFQRWICASTIMRRSAWAAAFCGTCVASAAPAAAVLVRKSRRDNMVCLSLFSKALLEARSCWAHLAPNAPPPQWRCCRTDRLSPQMEHPGATMQLAQSLPHFATLNAGYGIEQSKWPGQARPSPSIKPRRARLLQRLDLDDCGAVVVPC